MALAQTRTLQQIRFAAIHHSASAGVPVNLDQLKKRLATYDLEGGGDDGCKKSCLADGC